MSGGSLWQMVALFLLGVPGLILFVFVSLSYGAFALLAACLWGIVSLRLLFKVIPLEVVE